MIRSVFILAALGLSACAVITRHSEAGGSKGTFDYEDPDVAATKQMSPEERIKYDERVLLDRLERSIQTSEEKRQYQKYRSTLESDRERIEFLSMDGTTPRQRYIQSRGYSSSPTRYTRDIASLIEDNDIALGMARQAVRESWGDPEAVEVSGRPELGNERWRYIEYVSTPEGYQQEQRVLYFESGKLVGWEKY